MAVGGVRGWRDARLGRRRVDGPVLRDDRHGDEAVHGFSFEVLVRLFWWADEWWYALDGRFAASGIDPFDFTVRRFASLIYWVLSEGKDQEDLDSLDTRLATPMFGQSAAESAEAEAARIAEEMASFENFKAALGG